VAYVVAQPDPGVGDLQLGAAQPGGDPRPGLAARLGVLFEREGTAGERLPLQQWLRKPVVMVAGDQHDWAAAHRLAQLFEEWPGALQRGRERGLAQLQHVAEQDHSLRRSELAEQDAADPGVAQQVLAEGAAEVEVGDDRGSH